MRIIRIILIICLLVCASPLVAADELLDAGRAATIDYMLERAVSQGFIGGGVVLVGNSRASPTPRHAAQSVFRQTPPHSTRRTIFDIASLTKVVATAPAVMKLLEEGRITLLDPLTRWFPEFEGTGREDVTILNLLTHTSGLNDIAISSIEPLTTPSTKPLFKKTAGFPGADSCMPTSISSCCRNWSSVLRGCRSTATAVENFYGPLGMGDTMFLPPHELAGSIAPTLGTANELLTGVVQDQNARHLGGVAGHAGLFSSASDLSRFAHDDPQQRQTVTADRVFSERVLEQMTAPYFYSNGTVVRGLGWDIYSPYSSPRGSFFSEMSFGHTGYSGSSIWIDPQRDLFVILLTVRFNYRDTTPYQQASQ